MICCRGIGAAMSTGHRSFAGSAGVFCRQGGSGAASPPCKHSGRCFSIARLPAGWQGHPVSMKNWHFIVPAEVGEGQGMQEALRQAAVLNGRHHAAVPKSTATSSPAPRPRCRRASTPSPIPPVCAPLRMRGRVACRAARTSRCRLPTPMRLTTTRPHPSLSPRRTACTVRGSPGAAPPLATARSAPCTFALARRELSAHAQPPSRML